VGWREGGRSETIRGTQEFRRIKKKKCRTRRARWLSCYCAAVVVVVRRGEPTAKKMSSQRRPPSGGGASGGLAPPPRPRPRLLTTGGLKGWQYGVLVVSCVGSMLAGASVVHRLFPPDLSLPGVGEIDPAEERNKNGNTGETTQQ
ncbi:unnamed protein product, partial [Ectocarpus fasciculatus]